MLGYGTSLTVNAGEFNCRGEGKAPGPAPLLGRASWSAEGDCTTSPGDVALVLGGGRVRGVEIPDGGRCCAPSTWLAVSSSAMGTPCQLPSRPHVPSTTNEMSQEFQVRPTRAYTLRVAPTGRQITADKKCQLWGSWSITPCGLLHSGKKRTFRTSVQPPCWLTALRCGVAAPPPVALIVVESKG